MRYSHATVLSAYEPKGLSLQLTLTIRMMKGNNVQLNQAALPPPLEMFSRIIR